MIKVPFTLDKFVLLFFVDDGSLIFSTRRETILGANKVFEQMARMGLKMHVGIESKVSKTETVNFLSRSRITQRLSNHEFLKISSSSETFSIVEAEKK